MTEHRTVAPITPTDLADDVRHAIAVDGVCTHSGAPLADDSIVPGNRLVAGTGVEPRVDPACAAGLWIAGDEAGGGVLVEATLRTSHPHVPAIGDVASVPDPRLGQPIRVEHGLVAQQQGRWLARHPRGGVDDDCGEVPFFWPGHYDGNLRPVSHIAAPDDRRVDGDLHAPDTAVTIREGGQDQALPTCGRDAVALEVGAAWTR